MLARIVSSGTRGPSLRMLSAISFAEFGVPAQVLKLDAAAEVAEPGAGFVQVTMKSSRVSTEDIRSVSGHSLLNRSRGVAGTTGVGSVSGGNVFVVGSGTWNTHANVAGANVYPLPSKLSVEAAAQLDVVGSACAIMQQVSIAAGETMIVDVGDAALAAALSAVAKNGSIKVAKASDKVEHCKLAITSAGGEAFTNLVRQIANGGTVVRVNSSTADSAASSGVGAFIFQDKRIRGFDLHALARANPEQCGEAISAAAALMVEGKVSLPGVESFSQADFVKSIKAAQDGENAIISIAK